MSDLPDDAWQTDNPAGRLHGVLTAFQARSSSGTLREAWTMTLGVRAGCDANPAIVDAGFNPWGIAVDQATNTIYTANIANGEGPGTVSMINGNVCNGQQTTRCLHAARTVAAGFGANGIAVDQSADYVYATNIEDTSVSVIDGRTCNAHDVRRCRQQPARESVGDYPAEIAVDSAVRTAYVQDGEGISVIPLKR